MKIKDQIQELREQIARLTMHLVNKNEVLREQASEIAKVQKELCALSASVDTQTTRIDALLIMYQGITIPKDLSKLKKEG
jgi:hypothetical protein